MPGICLLHEHVEEPRLVVEQEVGDQHASADDVDPTFSGLEGERVGVDGEALWKSVSQIGSAGNAGEDVRWRPIVPEETEGCSKHASDESIHILEVCNDRIKPIALSRNIGSI